jgi:CheY-like chemotaxis protein
VYGFAVQSKGLAFIRREESGTTIGILLPRSEAVRHAPAARPARPSHGIDGLHVLYVEDDPDVAEVTAIMLESLGARVTRADSADAAVRLDLSGVDAVLSDVMMPGELDGIGLARWLSAHHPQLPVVLTSGYVLEPERLQGLKVQFVRKPCAIAALADALIKAAKQAVGN